MHRNQSFSLRAASFIGIALLVIGLAIAASFRPTSARASSAALSSQWYNAAPYVMPLANTPPVLTTVMSATGAKAFTLAFVVANGGCTPAWETDSGLDTVSSDTQIAPIISAIRAAGGDVVVSFGGYNGNKLGAECGSAQATAAAEQAVVSKYSLKALDFDLEEPEYENSTAIANELGAAQILAAQQEEGKQKVMEEIAFILADRPQQNRIAQAVSQELALRDLEVRKDLRTISLASHQLQIFLPEEAAFINDQWLQPFAPFLDASHDAERSLRSLSPKAKQRALQRMITSLRRVGLVEANTGELIYSYHGHRQSAEDVAWSPDGTSLASSGADAVVHVFHAATGRTLFTFQKQSAPLAAVVWSPNGKRIASGCDDGTVQIWYAHL